jgi:hypothetical protein
LNFVQEHVYEGLKLGEYICPECSSTMIVPNYQRFSIIYCNNCEPKKEWEYVNQAAKCSFCRDKDDCSQREFNFVQVI